MVVFLDGHTSHFSFKTIEYGTEKINFIAALYPNSTHLTQPMDVAGFEPLKKNWRESVHKWKTNTHSSTLTKDCFAETGTFSVRVQSLRIIHIHSRGHKLRKIDSKEIRTG